MRDNGKNKGAPSSNGAPSSHETATANSATDRSISQEALAARIRANCPDELRALAQWMCWERVGRKKIPHYAESGRTRSKPEGSNRDRAQMATLEVALDAMIRLGYDGVGLAFFESDDLTGFDADHVMNPDGSWTPVAEKLLAIPTYWERGPSGDGLHGLFFSRSTSNSKNKNEETGVGYEMFATLHFLTFTGDALRYDTVAVLDNETVQWLEQLATPPGSSSGPGRPRKDDPHRRKYSIEEADDMLTHLSPEDRDCWRNVGIALGREYKVHPDAWDAYVKWSMRYSKWDESPRENLKTMREAFEKISRQPAEKEVTIGTVIKAAIEHGWVPKTGAVPIDHFIFYGPGNSFLYRPVRDFWITEAVNAACSKKNVNGELIRASDWLRQNMLATSLTNDPSLDGDYVLGVDFLDGVMITVTGAATINIYRPPTIEGGDKVQAAPFLVHVEKIFHRDGDAKQFLDYMAHLVQLPGEKTRFALLIAGEQGVGKDTCVEMCLDAIGPWNVASIEPTALDCDFNEHAAKTLVRVNEAANSADISKWAFNEKLKVLIAGTPDYVTVNPKYGHKYSVRLHNGVILTTNHLIAGIYIPQDDRRYDVIECATKEEMGIDNDAKCKAYFDALWTWFNNGGNKHIAAMLKARDVSAFSASNGQRKTEAHRKTVMANLGQDHHVLDALHALRVKDANGRDKDPDLVRGDAIYAQAQTDPAFDSRFRFNMSGALERAKYVAFVNPARADGRWSVPVTINTSKPTKARKLTTIYRHRDFRATFEDIEKLIDALPEAPV